MSPINVLRHMGFDTLPILADALDDSTPTGVLAPTNDITEPLYTCKVNELVASLIAAIADHDSVVYTQCRATR